VSDGAGIELIIRHELHKQLSHKTVEEINRDALRKFQEWQTKYRANQAE
jgi:hypothetical protein